MSKKLFLVNTFVTFRHQYVVEAECLEHAYDEVTMRDSGHPRDDFPEVTQKCLGEHIIDGREITHTDFKTMLEALKSDESESSNHWLGDKLIRRISYDH